MRMLAGAGLSALLSVAVGPSQAHHSLPVLFDTSDTVTVTGEITEFEFVAPHAYIHLTVSDEAGEETAWELETFPPGMLIRKGLTPATLPPGQQITAQGYPARDGRPLMRLLAVTMPDGEEREVQ